MLYIVSTIDYIRFVFFSPYCRLSQNRKKNMAASVTYSLEECINHIGLGKYQWRLISIVGFCTMADAVEMMLLAILGPALTCYWSDITQMQIATLTTVLKLRL